MRKVFKYAVGLDREIKVELPSDSQLLRVEAQHGYQWLWALVDPESEPCIKNLICVGTGFKITEGSIRYIGTVFQDGVWHYFEVLGDK